VAVARGVTELVTVNNLLCLLHHFAAALAVRSLTKVTTVSISCLRRRLAVGNDTSRRPS
jgi:hypothetical protein